MDNNDKLVSGSKELASGATKISDGADKLHDGSKTLGKGLTTVDKGVTTLKKALKKGADTAKNTTISSKQKKMFASPVNANETQVSKVANNGSAMAAYMMCAGLWVAGISFCVVTVQKMTLSVSEERRNFGLENFLNLHICSWCRCSSGNTSN